LIYAILAIKNYYYYGYYYYYYFDEIAIALINGNADLDIQDDSGYTALILGKIYY
jgi:hypothetical protein